ncbi:MAG: hypothetical protein HFACDABA_00094 [Anaerolineales bacterium]|nr:hypothetical protein [Anaerolineales bacterium]
MDPNAFYALFSTTCFALVGLWWNAVSARLKDFRETRIKQNATGVYFSFLIPGMMGLGAQVTGADTPLWRAVFVIGAIIGIFVWVNMIRSSPKATSPGFFHRNRWLVVALYVVILIGSFGMDKLALSLAIQPIQVEAFMMCLLVLTGHGISWEVLMETPPDGH